MNNNDNKRAHNFRDLTDKDFGKLKVIGISNKTDKRKRVYWKCLCKCGNNTIVESYRLTSGKTKSCGCLKMRAGEKLTKINEEKHRNDEGIMVSLLKRKTSIDNTSGVKGVSVLKDRKKKYRAMIQVDKKPIFLGDYYTLEEAAEARKAGEEKYHKPHLDKEGK